MPENEERLLAQITDQFRDRGYNLKLHEKVPGEWDAVWIPIDRAVGPARTTGGSTRLDAAQRALYQLEQLVAANQRPA